MIKKQPSGFTLLEILVILALISILVVILFPVFAQLQEKARQTVCASNLHQIDAAVRLYKADYDDYYPYAIDNWTRNHHDYWSGFPFDDEIHLLPSLVDLLAPYSKSKAIFHCPSDVGGPDRFQLHGSLDRFTLLGSSYTFNESLGLFHVLDISFEQPSVHRYADDVFMRYHSPGVSDYEDYRGNALFLDGHIRFSSPIVIGGEL